MKTDTGCSKIKTLARPITGQILFFANIANHIPESSDFQ